MRAGLESHVERRTAGALAGGAQSDHFGMGFPGTLMKTAPDDGTVCDDHRAHGRIRTGMPHPMLPEAQRQAHEARIVGVRHGNDTAWPHPWVASPVATLRLGSGQ